MSKKKIPKCGVCDGSGATAIMPTATTTGPCDEETCWACGGSGKSFYRLVTESHWVDDDEGPSNA